MDRPRLKAHLTPRLVAPDQTFLVAEEGHYLVRGKAAVAITPYLDGTHTVPEIVSAVSDRVSFAECLTALGKFQRFGHLGGETDIDRRTAAAWEARQVDPLAAQEKLRSATVSLVAFGDVDVDAATDVLRLTGVRIGPDPDLVVVLTDEYLDPRIGALAAELRAAGTPWLLVKPAGLEVWLGPYFDASAGCWECLRQRLDGNRAVDQYLRVVADDPSPVRASVASLPWTAGLAHHLLTTAVTSILVGDSFEAGVLTSLHTVTLAAERHTLVRQPQCPGCGDPALMSRSPKVPLGTGQASLGADGGHRTVTADATLDRLGRHVSRLLGAVTALRPLTGRVPGADGLAHSYVAGHNFAVQRQVSALRRTLRGQSGGKGRTDAQARASGLCEALERYCGVWRSDRPVVHGALANLPDAISPEDLLLFSAKQYAQRNHAGRLHQVPKAFDPSQEIEWAAAWSLTGDRPRLVPASYAWFGHPDTRRFGFCYADANGNAAGNTLEEAILQGFCELVERDSVALWWYNRVSRPGVVLDDPYAVALQEFYAAQGRELWVLDLTADLDVPTFAAVSRRVDHPVEDVLLGFGAHLDARLALHRALTELNQFLPAVSARFPDGTTDYWEDDPETLAWWRDVRVADEPWLLPSGPPVSVKARDEVRDVADDVRWCVGAARSAGLEVVVLDQSRPDIELAVAKVMVPGLRHFWRRLGPGRLYDVPVRLGWSGRVAEDDLNPHSVFF